MQHPDPLSRMETLEQQLEAIHERMSRHQRRNTAEINQPGGGFAHELANANRADNPLDRPLFFWLFALLYPFAVTLFLLFTLPLWGGLLPGVSSPAPAAATPSPEGEAGLQTPPPTPEAAAAQEEDDAKPAAAKVADRVFSLYERLEELETSESRMADGSAEKAAAKAAKEGANVIRPVAKPQAPAEPARRTAAARPAKPARQAPPVTERVADEPSAADPAPIAPAVETAPVVENPDSGE